MTRRKNRTMSIRVDLHTHSTASDGVFSPPDLVREALRNGLDVIALTDHDSFVGSDQARTLMSGVTVIPGVELSIRDMSGLHLLGYGTALGGELRRTVEDLSFRRKNRARLMLEKLAELGMPLDADRLITSCQGSLGRPHIARAMVEAGYVLSNEEAFRLYIGNDGPAYVGGERLTMEQALHLMRISGFVPVLAHPAELKLPLKDLRVLVEKWRSLGLMGMEVYHPSARKYGMDSLDRMAREMHLLVTGGSDFHTPGDHHGELGAMLKHWRSCQEDYDALLDAMG